MQSPFFSIVVLVRGGLHLIPLTLHTTQLQCEKDFEVILISNVREEIAYLYPNFRLFQMRGANIPEMMNEGTRVAKGRYVQFLNPGDRILSCLGLSYLRQLIQERNEPHLAYSGCLMQETDESPRAVSFPFNRETLEKGVFPRFSHTSWFRRDTLIELKGFDETFIYRPSFEFLCRLYRKNDLRVVSSRRVLTDSESIWVSPKEMVGYVQETCRILYRHFGLWSALRWIFVQDHLQMLRWTAKNYLNSF